MAQKFNITESEATPRPKNFIPPIPGFQTKPTVIIGNVVSQAVKKVFINTGSEAANDNAVGLAKILNTRVYSNIEFVGASYTDENNQNVTFESLKIDLVLMTVNNQKNIVKTTLQGRNGTVKEYISDGDFSVKIEGKLFGDGAMNYPEGDVQKLIAVCLAPQAIQVNSDYLKLFDISNLVVETYDFPQTEGVRNYQEFTLNCVSDKELILLKNA